MDQEKRLQRVTAILSAGVMRLVAEKLQQADEDEDFNPDPKPSKRCCTHEHYVAGTTLSED